MLSMVVIAVTMTIFNTGIEIASIQFFESNNPVQGNLFFVVFRSLTIPATVFFGLWMFPLGYLFFKSGFMPKTLGIALMVGSVGYVIHAAYQILVPGATEQFLYLSVVAEVSTILWLVAFGVKRTSFD